MPTDFISITNLQKQLKSVFESSHPVRFVMSKNALVGMVFSKEAAELLMDSDLLRQIREELWEMNDPVTRNLVIRDRLGKTKPVPFESTLPKSLRKHGIRTSRGR